MDFRKLETFLTVANAGKFTDAAEKLFVSQSSLSKQMAQVEKELGVKLFKKTRNGVELTQAGFDFYTYARKTIPEFQRAVSRLQMYREGSKQPLNIGALPLTEEYGFADSFSSFWVRNPSVQFEYFERSQADLEDKLNRNKIDLALLRLDMLDEDEYAYVPIVVDELVIACSVKNPLANMRKVKISDLRNEQFILLEEKSDVTQIFRQACEHEGFCPNTPLHHSRHRMLIKAVQNNMGITVLPSRLVATYQANDLTTVSLAKPLFSTLGFAWRSDELLSAVAKKLVEFVCADFNVDLRGGDGAEQTS